jgi:hypothetical protein
VDDVIYLVVGSVLNGSPSSVGFRRDFNFRLLPSFTLAVSARRKKLLAELTRLSRSRENRREKRERWAARG